MTTEMKVYGMGARASRALLLTERTDEARSRATEAVRGAGLAGRASWAARDREPACWRLMVVGDAWDDVVAALDAAGVAWEEVS